MVDMTINQPDVLAEVEQQFKRYELALTTNDTVVLDELFWHSPHTVRLGAGENLYGIEDIQAFRASRPAVNLDRCLRNTVITTYGDEMAVCSTEFTRDNTPKIGRQQQTWVKFAQGWRIVAAHVSLMS
ncbi:oxalurate catabolism protein HpxZ [Rosenbergiella sp. S61]|uniref:Oxalurate catabolism protein HpxZ n=1 Tax=Rosenbergiella gaditana TaxID=2726987 RepID=A0ABS5SZP4_9GAMM|nr:oxalurate catabolism protein HpxZ [Rosenbergiella gaditana]MBT0725382.1 oxalurate catabolism protein HpxZ [Rosenbergiella gaditana]